MATSFVVVRAGVLDNFNIYIYTVSHVFGVLNSMAWYYEHIIYVYDRTGGEVRWCHLSVNSDPAVVLVVVLLHLLQVDLAPVRGRLNTPTFIPVHTQNIAESVEKMFREYSGTFMQYSWNVQGIFREYFNGTIRDCSGNINGTFRECSGNIQGIFIHGISILKRTLR